MTAVLVIGSAVVALTALFALWNWAVGRVVARQEAHVAEEMRRGRW